MPAKKTAKKTKAKKPQYASLAAANKRAGAMIAKAIATPPSARSLRAKVPNTTGLLAELTGIRDGLAKSRDRLREIQGEIETLLDSADTAHDEIDAAVQTLSRYL